MTKAKKVLPISGCVAPQLFSIEKDKFLFFEKVNPEEGRFFTLDNKGIDVIYDTNEAQGIIEGGELYTISIGKNTLIKRLGDNPMFVNIEGTYFDFKVDEDKNIICLGHNGEESIIKIFSSSGREIKSIKIKTLLFGSSIKVEKDEIWVAGFDKNNTLKLIKINYIGYVLKDFTINTDSNERIISKIQIYKDNIYIMINGKKDSIYILNNKGDKVKELFSRDVNLENLTDFLVKEDNIHILSNKKIHIFDTAQVIITKDRFKLLPSLKNNIKIPYGYFMLLEMIKENFYVGIISSLVIYTWIYRLEGLSNFTIENVFFIWILSAFLSLCFSSFKFRKKSTRIMCLLNLQSSSESKWLERSLFMCTITLSTISLLFIHDFRIIVGIVCVIAFAFVIFVDKLFEGYLEHKREDIVVELLSGDQNLNANLKSLMKQSKKGNKILLNIRVEKDFNKKYLSMWSESRAFILGNSINYVFLDKTFISVVDLSKRDIKYSKISILADLICYIGEIGSIKEVNAMWVD